MSNGIHFCLMAFQFKSGTEVDMKTGIWAARLVAVTLLPVFAAAQQNANAGVNAQREAMHKLVFLAGRWSGPVTIHDGPGEPLHLTQTEDVQFKLDGLVLLIEGISRDAQGKVQFNALATVSYDEASHAYRFRAYNQGHYIDTELSVATNGFSWSFPAGPGHVVNTMRLTPKGEWSEESEFVTGSDLPHPSHPSVEMLLTRQP